jgi:hypothetical protein
LPVNNGGAPNPKKTPPPPPPRFLPSLRAACTEDRAHVRQCLAVVTDGVAEGRLAFHPKDFYKSHKQQVAESAPYIEQYGSERLPKYMQVCERVPRARVHP